MYLKVKKFLSNCFSYKQLLLASALTITLVNECNIVAQTFQNSSLNKDSEYTILYNDKVIDIKWPLEKIFPQDINLSLKDSKGISLEEALINKKLF